ncbi:MAG: N-acetylglucosaminyldiphosphoundecaprenol [Candidatus Peregrinibacteria bacterium Gr01-1014_25]|nr:MAG: N-acetylglucosaminyldiphosphoundecaprenol [Candidatus Peregrinibacteria bacterium Gr01-1014_25]
MIFRKAMVGLYRHRCMERIHLLGIPIDALTMEQALVRLRALLTGDAQCHVMTPNSEMLVAAVCDPAFAAVLRSTSLNLPDSAGLLWAARWTGQNLPERVAGVDAMTRFLEQVGEDHGVFLLGADEGIAARAADALRARNPRLRVVGTHAGSPSPADAPSILDRIRAASPSILLVAYGAPAQDLWIHTHLRTLPSVRLAVGVGGTFDFWAGKRHRAPLWLQRLGLEWLWRLVREPRRWRRIFTAVVVFPWMVVRHKKDAESLMQSLRP